MRAAALALLTLLLAAPLAFGGDPIPGFTETRVVTGLNDPTDITFSPSDGAMWILEKGGNVWIKRTGQPLKLALTLTVQNGCEQGLLGMAFDPQFTTNRRVYLYYTISGPPERNRVHRFVESGDLLSSDAVIVDDLYVSACNHDGGVLQFGPDGKLYVGVGENARPSEAQNLNSYLGKVLRINTDGTAPSDNPFYNQAPRDPRIYVYGLRNPWRLDFDDATGDMYVGDVGAGSWEEVNFTERGLNYGWPLCEGFCSPPDPRYEDPIHAYDHTNACGVTGGPVYRGSAYPPSFTGVLFFGDICGFVKYLTQDASHNVTGVFDFVDNAGSPVDIEIGPDGNLYYCDHWNGNIARVDSTAPVPPVADFSAAPRTGVAPLAVTFTNLTTGNATSYLWDFGDGGTSAATAPAHTYGSPGTYNVALTATGPGGSDTETKGAYVVVTPAAADGIVSGLGPDGGALPRVQAWNNVSQQQMDFVAYGTTGYGVNVGRGDVNGSGTDEILTGPGPSGAFGPLVRAFATPSAAPYTKVAFYAYNTLRFGARAEGGDVDGDGIHEILTAPGPGGVFGPHVRGWNWDGGTLASISKINFFAYSTLKFGCRVTGSSIDPDGFAEIVAGAGPSGAFGANVRGFNYDNASITSISKVNFVAYAGLFFGAEVGSGDVDGDGIAEILTGPGAAPANPSQARGFNFDGVTLAAIAGLDFTTYTNTHGILISAGDVDGDGRAEVLTMPAAPTLPANGRGWDFAGGVVTPLPNIDFVADPARGYGGNIDAGAFGF